MEAFLSSLHLLLSPVVQTRRKRFALAGLNIFLEGQNHNVVIGTAYCSFSIREVSFVYPLLFLKKSYFYSSYNLIFLFRFFLCITYIDV